jgi:glutamyl-tRNA synthetase
MAVGRFAPSPTGDLHLGNLRTALVAWLAARSTGSAFIVRMEDLDVVTASPAHEASQLRDLAALGLDWDGPVVRQSERFDSYHEAIARLTVAGLTYECWCSRREIREASAAPHGPDPRTGTGDAPDGAYPGTCRKLSAAELRERRGSARSPALRLRAAADRVVVVDRIAGRFTGVVDDVVLRRNDGVPAYNLAVVVDDAAQGVEEVVRGDDLLSSTPRQVHLARLLGLAVPAHAHVALVLAPDGRRLAKRHGSVTLADRAARGQSAHQVRSWLAASLGLAEPGEPVAPAELVARYDHHRLRREPWVVPADDL